MIEMQAKLMKQMDLQNHTMLNVNTRMDEMNKNMIDTALQRAGCAHELAARTNREVQLSLERSAASHKDQMDRFENQLKEGLDRMDHLKQECRQAALDAAGDRAVRPRDRAPAFVAQGPRVQNPYEQQQRLDQDRDGGDVELLLIIGGFKLNTRRPDIEAKLRSIVNNAGVQALDIFSPYRRGRIGMVKMASYRAAQELLLKIRQMKIPCETEAGAPASFYWASHSRPKEERERTQPLRKAIAILRTITGQEKADLNDPAGNYRAMSMLYGDDILMKTDPITSTLEPVAEAWLRHLPGVLPDFLAKLSE